MRRAEGTSLALAHALSEIAACSSVLGIASARGRNLGQRLPLARPETLATRARSVCGQLDARAGDPNLPGVIRTTLVILAFVAVAGAAAAQERLSVGVIERPPFAMRTEDGAWSGMAVDLWRFAADDLDLDYDYVPVDGPEALERGEVDLVMPV